MTDRLIEQSDGFRIGTKPSDNEIDHANWLIDRLSARILADADRIEELEDENAELLTIIARIDEVTPRADRTCDEPGITISEAVRRERAALAGLKGQDDE